ncbi:hypothetical protein A2635_02195 [Candidatus Peribacteria bacterium RIFCSPHIGHO2_01_FULL_51_9]|nr:MAG: hypothetical protein A2635_02195 [Candidatus Peribacteria bacterium RIFCSPHIGHO2_01_FULL_51_9]
MRIHMKTLGVIGGMGPQASIRFLDLVIRCCTEKFGVRENDQFPRIIMSNLPAPDLIANRKKEKEAARMLTEEAQKLERAGADFLVMTCNTMHLLADCCTSTTSIPFLSIIDTVVKRAGNDGIKRIGLLGSLTTMTSDLYLKPLRKAGIEVVTPSATDRMRVVACIKNVIAGQATRREEKIMQGIIRTLEKKGCEAVILGCTELPLIVNRDIVKIPILDSLELLADAACEEIFR